MPRLILSSGVLSLLVASASCTVYAPLVPAAPQVTARQVEVKAQVGINRSLEANVAYSPIPHLNLLAAGGLVPDNRDTSYFQARQYEIGAGYYTTLDEGNTYLSVAGGFGQARTVRGYQDVGIASPWLPLPVPTDLVEYRTKYNKYFVQAHGWVKLGEKESFSSWSLGAVVRSTWLDFQRVTLNGVPANPSATRYTEYCLLGKWGTGPVQGVASAGFSVPGFVRRDATAPVSKTTILINAGVLFYPHLLGSRR